MKQCANLVPEDKILTEECWDLVLREIIYTCKYVFDAEIDIAIERLLYCNRQQKGQNCAQFLTI